MNNFKTTAALKLKDFGLATQGLLLSIVLVIVFPLFYLTILTMKKLQISSRVMSLMPTLSVANGYLSTSYGQVMMVNTNPTTYLLWLLVQA